MAIIGIGVDVTLISRISQTVNRYGDRFLRRTFHPTEIAFSLTRRKRIEFLAACFAVKEAALKSLGDFPGKGIPWNSIYITHETTGKPILHFEGRALALSQKKGVHGLHVSITHDGDYAIAYVILED